MKRKISFFCTVMLLSMASVFAQSELETYDIVVVSNPPEVLGISCWNLSYGTIITIHCYPSYGWEFVNWTVDSIVVSTELHFTFTVIQSCTLVANFIQMIDVIDDAVNSVINIYPNPTTGVLRIELRQAQLPNGELRINDIEIFDIVGRRQKAEGRKQNEIDISCLQSGIYFVKVLTEKGVITKKIVKY